MGKKGEKADVVIVGAGIAGSAAAWWLARRGRHVVVVEQFEQGHGRGSSHGATRIFRLAYPDSRYVAMAQEALPLWREMEDDAGCTLLETTGALDHGNAREVVRVAEALAARGVGREVLGPEEAAERWPGRRFEGPVLFHAEGGRCLADAAVRALQDRAAAHGADVRFGTGPASLDVHDDAVTVRVDGGGWRAPVAIVAAGAWTERLIAGVPGATEQVPPLRVSRERVQHFDGADPGWPSFIHHRRPWMYGLFSPGEGMKVAAHMAGEDVDPGELDAPDVSAATGSDDVVRYVETWFPGLDTTPKYPASCLYTTTPTEDFVLERVGPVVIGTACSGHGFKFAPLVGRQLADLASP